MIIWQTNKRLNRVPGGRKVELPCAGCLKAGMYYESELEENLKLYFLVEIWKKTKRILQCGACLSVCDYYEIFPAEKQAAEAAEAARKKKKEEQAARERIQKAEEDLRRQRAAEQERARLEHEHNQRLMRAKAEKEAAVDDELAKLKKQMGR